MNVNALISRRAVLSASSIVLAAASVLPATAAFADAPAAPAAAAARHEAASPSDLLASTPWKTTGALDANGDRVALDDPAVANFVGWAYFKADGTFAMYNLDDSPKMHGDWSVPADGSTRTIVAKDAAGNVLFTRVTPIVQLDAHTFTYRVFPNAADTSVYYDIVHTKTDHAEPGTGTDHGNGGFQSNSGEGGYHFNHGNDH